MQKLSILAYLALFSIVATALWYFGHHRPAEEILRAEPQQIYRPVTPLATDTSAAKQQTAGTNPVHASSKETRESSVTEISNGTSPSSIEDVSDTGIQSQNDVKRTKHGNTQHDHSHEKAISVSEKIKMMEREHNEIIDNALQQSEAALSRLTADSKTIVAMLNQMPLEKQRALLNEFRKSIYSEASEVHFPEEISHLLPDLVDLADQTWNFFVDAWADHGYRIPSEWQELN
ncbi:hypothetical protein J5I95_22890 [Candidatus Poribacteria bacterium]|nr:hypothetical protein [Candidatus Poribacteria bacterium]